MPETIENYKPQKIIEGLKTQAFNVWGIILSLVAIWVFVIVLTPIAEANGFTTFSQPLYNFYSYICHQMPSRSFHIFEHKFAVCSRCFGVYFGLLFGLIIYPLFRSMEEIEPFPRIWLFLAMIPMGVDWALTFFGIWENTFFTRFVSGLILGTTCAIFIVPALVEFSEMILLKRLKRQEKKLS